MVRRAVRGIPRPLAALLIVAAIEVLAWTAFATPLEGPDEQNHFGYVQHIAETGHPPKRDFSKDSSGPYSAEQAVAMDWMGLFPLVGIPGQRPVWNTADVARWHLIERTQSRTWNRKDGGGPNAIAQNPPLYYLYEAIPYEVASGAPFFDRVFLMRLAGGALFVATVLFVWLLAGELFNRRRWLQTTAAAAAALVPQVAFMSTVINPDTGLTALWAAFMWLAARLLRGNGGYGTLVAAVSVAAASTITHGRGLGLALPAIVVALLWLRRRRVPLGRALPIVAGSAASIAATVLLGFQITTGSGGGAAYGGEATVAAAGFSIRGFLNYVWQFYLPALPGMSPPPVPGYGFHEVFVKTFFGTFGALEVEFPRWVYGTIHVAAVAGIAALVWFLVRRRREVVNNWPTATVLALVAVVLLGVLHYVAYRDMLRSPGDPVLVGRYIMPLLPLFGISIAFVACSLPRRMGLALSAGVIVAGALLQLAGLGVTAARFYG